jgi:hypothetical protein
LFIFLNTILFNNIYKIVGKKLQWIFYNY